MATIDRTISTTPIPFTLETTSEGGDYTFQVKLGDTTVFSCVGWDTGGPLAEQQADAVNVFAERLAALLADGPPRTF